MYSIALNHDNFDQYSLPDGEYPMPQGETVVSVDKNFNPVSKFSDNRWDFNKFFNNNGSKQSKYIIKFVQSKHNPHLLIELKQRIYFLIWGGKAQLLDTGRTLRKFEASKMIADRSEVVLRCFKGTEINQLSMLSNELVFLQILHHLSEHSEQHCSNTLKALSILSSLNTYFPKERHFQLGVPEGKTLNKLSKKYSTSGKGHNPTIIPAIYEQLMGHLIEDVELAYKDLSILSNVKTYAIRKGVTEREALRLFRVIEGACFMACSAFSGMRSSELCSLSHNSYSEIDVEGITLPIIRSTTKKLEVIEREDVWACAPICKKALSILKELNNEFRSEPHNIHLSPRFSFKGSSGTGDSISKQLKDVVINQTNLNELIPFYSQHLNIQYDSESMDEAYNLLNPVVSKRNDPRQKNDDGTIYWRFTIHSLRRSFAHFVVGNGLVSLASLKQQFKHVHLSMTAIYASHSDVLTLLGIENQASVKKAIEQAEEAAHVKYLKDMIDNPDEQSGGFMKAFEGDPRVMSNKEFESLVQKTKGANKTTGYGRCFAGTKCKMAHIFEPSNCVGEDCANLNINREEAKHWYERHNKLCRNIDGMKQLGFFNRNTLARELSDIRAAEKVMHDHGITFERFELGEM